MRRAVLLLSLVILATCGTNPAHSRREVTVAAAANLVTVFQTIGSQFEAQTGIHPVFSFASTAQLAQQIENAAPFDVFTAADAEHIDELDLRGLLLPDSKAVYATGVLALWIPPRSRAAVSRLEDLMEPSVQVIAVANPALAPYGSATIETLNHLGILSQVRPKIVYAENINMAKQYGISNNADAVFTAYSLVMHAGGKTIPVEEDLHRPITQELGIVANTKHQEAARKFVAFLVNGAGRSVLQSSGYR